MTDAITAAAGGQRGLAARVEQAFENLYVAAAVCIAVGAVATWLFPEIWLVRPGIAEYPVLSRLAFVAMLIVMVVLSHLSTRRTVEIVSCVFGTITLLLLTGLPLTVMLLVLTVFTYHVTCRLPMVVGLVITYLLIFTCAYLLGVFGGIQPLFGLHAMKGVPFAVGFGSARLVYYVFEHAAVPKAKRSFWSVAAYANFGIILWTGPLISYVTYTATKPDRGVKTRLGIRQLYRSAGKMLLWAAGGALLTRMVPEIVRFDLLRTDLKLFVMVLFYVMWWARISAVFDLATSVGNLCGYSAPNALDNFLGCTNAMQAFRRHDVHGSNFIVRTLGYPIARLFKSKFMRVLGLIVGALICRSTLFETGFAYMYGKRAFHNILGMNGAFHPINAVFGFWWIVVLLVSSYMQDLQNKYPRLFTVPFWLLFQSLTVWTTFGGYWGDGMTMHRPPEGRVPVAQRKCFEHSLFSPSMTCPRPPPPADGKPPPEAAGRKPFSTPPGTTPPTPAQPSH